MEEPVSKQDAVLIVSRAATLYLVCWALNDLMQLPASALMLSRHANDSMRMYEITSVASMLARIAGLFTAAVWLYRCGPGVASYFLPSEKQANSEDGPGD
jgi:hypothetical protein